MWDTKYRPLKFADVLGQTGTIQLLKARLRNGSALETSYIFAGGFGQGKTTLSRIFSRAMLCLNRNKEDCEPCNECDNCQTILSEMPGAFVERDAASQGTVEHIRAIVDDLPFAVYNAPKRIYLFDEAHRMGTAAQDVLLKPIEEKKMVGIFCTTEAEKIRGTIRSRCEEHTIRKVTREEILVRMKDVLQKEGVEYEDDAVLIVIDHSGGHVRDIFNKLESASQIGPISVDNIRGFLRLSVVSTFYEILLSLGDAKRAIELVEQACERVSPEEVASGLAEASMNSFRLANGMFTDFAHIDRSLGIKVYERYGIHVVRLAEWFLRSRYISQVSVLRDVLTLHQASGHLPPEGSPPPILFAAPGAATVVVSAPTVAAVSSAPSTTTVAPAPAEIPLPEVDEGPPVLVPPPLHPVDAKLNLKSVPMPRMIGHQPRHLIFPDKGGDDALRKLMAPDEWRKEFEKLWPNRGDGV